MKDPDLVYFLRKLRLLHDLGAEEIEAMLGAIDRIVAYKAHQVIVADESKPTHSCIMLSGIAARVKFLPNGKRQVLAFQFPGDATDLYGYVLRKMDHSVTAITDCRIATIPHERVRALTDQFRELALALWRDTIVDSSIRNMAVVNLGARPARARLAHYICEQFARLAAVGLAELASPTRFYVTQSDIADATGLSLVHVNKTLQSLKKEGLIGRDPQMLEILDWEGLKSVAGFNPDYLHFKMDDVGQNFPSGSRGSLQRAD